MKAFKASRHVGVWVGACVAMGLLILETEGDMLDVRRPAAAFYPTHSRPRTGLQPERYPCVSSCHCAVF
jgi:hypothetical protein